MALYRAIAAIQIRIQATVGFLYGAGAETQILVTGTPGKIMSSRAERTKSVVYTKKTKKKRGSGIRP